MHRRSPPPRSLGPRSSWPSSALRVVGLILAAAVVAACAGVASTAASGAAALPRVTLIGDSVMTSVLWYPEPRAILRKRFDVDLQIEVCRSLVAQSCPFEGRRPPTVVETVRALGTAIRPTVVIEGGYNEPVDGFEAAVEQVLQALRDAHATRVIWIGLSESTNDFGRMNAILRAVATRHPELEVVDWQTVSADHNDWFQTDHIHLTWAGGVALARLVRDALAAPPRASMEATAPLRISAPASAALRATVGIPFRLVLRARGGAPPYRWSVVDRALPRGLHLRGSVVSGTPTVSGDVRVLLRVVDAGGRAATARVALAIRAEAG